MGRITMQDSSGLSRRERERLRRQNEVLSAAELLFAERGYHSVSMQDIATKAEFAVGTLYQFFPSKEELYVTIVDSKVNAFMEIVSEALSSSSSPLSCIEKLIESHVSFFLKEISFFKIYVAETKGFIWNIRVSMDKNVQGKYQDYRLMLNRIFSEAVRKRQLYSCDPDDLALGFIGIVHTFLTHWIMEDSSPSVEDGVKRIKNVFLDRLIRKGK